MSPKNYRKFAFRTNAFQIAEWAREASRRNVSLSQFIKEAARKESASMLDAELNQNLLAIRSALNAAYSVRTPEQKNARIAAVRDHVTALINRKSNNQFWR